MTRKAFIMVAAILVLPHLNAHLLNAREASHSDWIDVNPNPSLSTATSWKEAYISETFWKKYLLARLWPWEHLFREDLFDFWLGTSWEMMYKNALSYGWIDCYTINDVYLRCVLYEPWKERPVKDDAHGI